MADRATLAVTEAQDGTPAAILLQWEAGGHASAVELPTGLADVMVDVGVDVWRRTAK